MPLRYTVHADLQVAERALEPAWVEATLAAPDWEDADPRHADRRRAYRAIPERDGRILRVVYEVDGADTIVVSAFFDRNAPRRRPTP